MAYVKDLQRHPLIQSTPWERELGADILELEQDCAVADDCIKVIQAANALIACLEPFRHAAIYALTSQQCLTYLHG